MIDYLVLQNADQPAPFRRAAAKFLVAAHGGEKGFLHQVFGDFGFADSHYSVSVKTLVMVVYPARCYYLNIIHDETRSQMIVAGIGDAGRDAIWLPVFLGPGSPPPATT